MQAWSVQEYLQGCIALAHALLPDSPDLLLVVPMLSWFPLCCSIVVLQIDLTIPLQLRSVPAVPVDSHPSVRRKAGLGVVAERRTSSEAVGTGTTDFAGVGTPVSNLADMGIGLPEFVDWCTAGRTHNRSLPYPVESLHLQSSVQTWEAVLLSAVRVEIDQTHHLAVLLGTAEDLVHW